MNNMIVPDYGQKVDDIRVCKGRYRLIKKIGAGAFG